MQLLLGGRQQFVSLAAAFLGQQRIAAGDQPLAWVGGMLNLGQVALVEQDNCNCPPKYSRSEPQSRRPRRSSRYPNPPPTPASVRVPLLLSGENRLLLGGTEYRDARGRVASIEKQIQAVEADAEIGCAEDVELIAVAR